MFFFDSAIILFALPGLILGLLAQALLWYAYGRYSQVSADSNITGMQAAEILNEKEGFGVSFITTPGKLNDYYDPSKHVVNLSQDNAHNGSVANIAVVAHEFGHVQQRQSGLSLFKLRGVLVPAVNIGSNLGIILVLIGLAISFTDLAWLGVALFSLTTLFSLITLPIEIDASRRGMALLRKHNLVATHQLGGAKTVLMAAGLTYFAALISSMGQLLYYVMLVQGSNKD